MTVSPEAYDPSAWVSAEYLDKVCSLCGQPAGARLLEVIPSDDPFAIRHPLSAYVCASHFQQIMGLAEVAHVTEYRAASREIMPVCRTCHDDGRVLHHYDRGPSGLVNSYIGCPDCDLGRLYDDVIRREGRR